LFSAAAFCQSSSPKDSAATDTTSTSNPKNISGFWKLSFDSKVVPSAVLVPKLKKDALERQAAADRNAIRWCQHLGMPYMMEADQPIDIVQGAREITVVSEAPSATRHISLDRTAHPDRATYDEQTNGDSIAHWEGNALVVDTVGLSEDGYRSIPGGGFKTKTSHLIEHFELVNGGSQLQVTSTWDDPQMFARPHTYTYRYDRAEPGYNAVELYCDASNVDRAKFLGDSQVPEPGHTTGGQR
jgi:hypothetical protein